MKKYIIFFVLLYSVSFSFTVGIALEKNIKTADIISDSQIILSKSQIRIAYFKPGNVLHLVYVANGVNINGLTYSLPLNLYSTIGLVSVDGNKYRNKILLKQGKNGFTIVNSLDSEEYISDVMMNFPKNLEPQTYDALAIVLRSFLYALKHLYPNDDYFITKDNKYFPYKGYINPNKNVLYALKTTKNMVLFYKGNPVYAYYSYDCGGITASADEIFGYKVGYLQSVPSPFGSDDSRYSQWSYYYTNEELTRIFSHFIKGKIYSVSILSRTKSGRVALLYIKTDHGHYRIKGQDIYNWIGRNILPSLVFNVSKFKKGYKFVGKGYGSGLGMPIYDANSFAQRGYSYKDILNHFYPFTTIKVLQ